jgi:hypothetical protein
VNFRSRSFAVALMLILGSIALSAQPSHTSIPPGNVAFFKVQAQDDGGTSRAATAATVTLDRTDAGYIAPTGEPGKLVFVSKPVPAGTVTTVTATITAKNDRGADLPAYVMLFDVQGPPLPPAATHIAVTEGPFVRDTIGISVPPDPGTASVSFAF